jgi:hypothetical protein
MMQSVDPIAFMSIEMLKSLLWPALMLCSITADFSGWPSCMSHMLFASGCNDSANLSNIDCTTML